MATNFTYGLHWMDRPQGAPRARYPVYLWDPREELPALWGCEVPQDEVVIATDGSYEPDNDTCSAGIVIATPRTNAASAKLDAQGNDRYDTARAVFSGAFIPGGDGNYTAELLAIAMALVAVPVTAKLTIVFDCTSAVSSTSGRPLKVDTGYLRDPEDAVNGLRDSVLATLKRPSHALVNAIRRLLRLRAEGGGEIRFVHQKSHTVPDLLHAKEEVPLYAAMNGMADAACAVAMHAVSMGASRAGAPPLRGAANSWGGRAIALTENGKLIRGNARRAVAKSQRRRREERLAVDFPSQGKAFRASNDLPGDIKRMQQWAKKKRSGDTTLLKTALGLEWSAHRLARYMPDITGGREECACCSGSWTGSRQTDRRAHATAGCPAGLFALQALDASVHRLLEPLAQSDGGGMEAALAAIETDEAEWSCGFWREDAVVPRLIEMLVNRQAKYTAPATASGAGLRLGKGTLTEINVSGERLEQLVARAQLDHVVCGHAPPDSIEEAAGLTANAVARAFWQLAGRAALTAWEADDKTTARRACRDISQMHIVTEMERIAVQQLGVVDVRTWSPLAAPLQAATWRHKWYDSALDGLLVQKPLHSSAQMEGRSYYGAQVTCDDRQGLRSTLIRLHGSECEGSEADQLMESPQPTRLVVTLTFKRTDAAYLHDEWARAAKPEGRCKPGQTPATPEWRRHSC